VLRGPSGLNDFQEDKFFEILSKKTNDLEIFLRELYEVPGHKDKKSIHLSFGTKLLHTLNENLPIYDSNVARILDLPKQKSFDSLDLKIANRISIYNELINDYDALLKNSNILSYLKTTRSNLAKRLLKDSKELNIELVSNTKLLDSSLWALDSVKRDIAKNATISG
jgi:hypothetical protein